MPNLYQNTRVILRPSLEYKITYSLIKIGINGKLCLIFRYIGQIERKLKSKQQKKLIALYKVRLNLFFFFKRVIDNALNSQSQFAKVPTKLERLKKVTKLRT